MKIKPAVLALVILVILFGGIQVASAMGLWQTTSSKVPAKFESGEYAGVYNPSDIRGSYTFAEIADVFQIKEDVLLQAFGFAPETNPAQIKSKDLEARFSGADFEIGNGSMQVFVALYQNLPIDLADEGLPSPAVDIILAANQMLNSDSLAWLESHRVDISGFPDVAGGPETGQTTAVSVESSTAAPAEPSTAAPAESATESHETKSDSQVKGTTTFQQVLDAGITREQIEEILGVPLPAATNQAIKDFCVSQDIPFSTVKEQLSDLMP